MPALTAVLESLWRAYPWDIVSAFPRRRERRIVEHRTILDAIIGNDRHAIEYAVGENLRLSYLALMEHLTVAAGEDPFVLGND